jgi:hypothetical protein
MTGWSILAGLLGMLGTGATASILSRRKPSARGLSYWLLGMAALLPAWLIAFFDLLGRSSGPRPERVLTASWILSSSAVLLGVIATDAALRRLREWGRNPGPVLCWLLGVLALLPGWGVAILGLALKTKGQ